MRHRYAGPPVEIPTLAERFHGMPEAVLGAWPLALAYRSSSSSGVQSKVQRLFSVGRPGIEGLRVCLMSPIGSFRRGL